MVILNLAEGIRTGPMLWVVIMEVIISRYYIMNLTVLSVIISIVLH